MYFLCQRCRDEGRGETNDYGPGGYCRECFAVDVQAAKQRAAVLNAMSTGDDMRDVMLDVLGLLEQCEVRR